MGDLSKYLHVTNVQRLNLAVDMATRPLQAHERARERLTGALAVLEGAEPSERGGATERQACAVCAAGAKRLRALLHTPPTVPWKSQSTT